MRRSGGITDLGCREFTAQLAGEAPIPGGSAAAVCGALAVALGEMVASLTIGRKKYYLVEGEAMIHRERLDDIRHGMLNAAEMDAASFEPLSRACALPKDATGRAETLEKLLLIRRCHAHGDDGAVHEGSAGDRAYGGYRVPPRREQRRLRGRTVPGVAVRRSAERFLPI